MDGFAIAIGEVDRFGLTHQSFLEAAAHQWHTELIFPRAVRSPQDV